MIAAQLVTFFMIRFIRLPWMVMLASRIVVTRSRGAALHGMDLFAVLAEEQVLKFLDWVVELLHDGEVPVDQDIQEPGQQESERHGWQDLVRRPASGHLIDVKAGVLRTVIRAWSVTNTAI